MKKVSNLTGEEAPFLLEENKKKKAASKGKVALKGCSYKDSKIRAGEVIPSDWPKSAIDELVKAGAIEG